MEKLPEDYGFTQPGRNGVFSAEIKFLANYSIPREFMVKARIIGTHKTYAITCSEEDLEHTQQEIEGIVRRELNYVADRKGQPYQDT